MSQYATKYFGNISIDETSDFEDFDVEYQNQAINISLCDCNNYGDKFKTCLEIIDRYIEINEIAKKALLDNCFANKTIPFYFEHHFNELNKEEIFEIFGVRTFNEFDIKKAIENLPYPDLLFDMEDEEIRFSADYQVSKEYSDEILCVKMDKKLNVTNISHES